MWRRGRDAFSRFVVAVCMVQLVAMTTKALMLALLGGGAVVVNPVTVQPVGRSTGRITAAMSFSGVLSLIRL